MIRATRWLSFAAVLLLLTTTLAGTRASSAAPSDERAGAPSLHLKDGEDDEPESSGGGSDDETLDDSSDNSGQGSSSSNDSNSGDVTIEDDSNTSNNSGSGSDDASDDHGSDTPDDSGRDDVSDDSGSDSSGHGNDDFHLAVDVASTDGATVAVVDGDKDAATDGFRAGQAIVRLQPNASIDAFNQRYGTTLVAAINTHDLYLLRFPEGQAEDDALRQISGDPDTRWAELNYVNQAPEGRPGYFFVSGEAASTPGETYTPGLLGYGDATQTCATGKGVVVAVLDTGIDVNHPELAHRIHAGGWNALNNSADVADVGNDLDDDGDGLVDEMVGHGTHVAGIIAQVAPDASILPVKVLGSDGLGDAFYVAAGIYYAVDQGADVINLSLSSTYDARVVADAVAEANEAGVVVVAAAGNRDSNRVLEFPAADTGVLGIAATDQDDKKGEFSNYGDRIDLSAPGVAIVSALPGGRYAAWSGTSMASPFVAGAAALLAGEHTNWTAPEITKRLRKTAKALDDLNPDFAGELGAGRVDIRAAVGCSAENGA